MFVTNRVFAERFAEHLFVELGITLRPGPGSHIGQQLDSVLIQQRNEDVDPAGRMPDRPDSRDHLHFDCRPITDTFGPKISQTK